MAEDNQIGVNPGEDEEVQSKGNTLMNIVMILLLIVLLSAESYGAFLLVKFNYAKINDLLTFEEAPPEPGTYDLNELIINTNDARSRFVMMSIFLELYNVEDIPLITEKEKVIRDAINKIVGRRTAQELNTLQVQKQLKQEIGIMINEIIGKNSVTNLYFPQYQIS